MSSRPLLAHLLGRLGWLALTLWCVVTLSFFLMRSVKGGPFDAERRLPPEIEAALAARYHLDWPVWRQYLHYLGPLNLDERGLPAFGGDGTKPFGGLCAGELGPSLRHRDQSVGDLLAASLPVSLALGSLALAWALVVGLCAGVGSALARGVTGAPSRAGLLVDGLLRVAATLGVALPSFVVAGFLVLLFSFVWPLLPPAGWGGARHLVLPALALGLPYAAWTARLSRTGLVEVLSSEWIRAARAKGLSPRLVVTRHALKAGLLPVLSWLGPAAAGVLTGSLVVERVFAIPGCGTHFVNAALARDYTLALGVTLVYALLVFTLNAAVDLAYRLLDPRIGALER